MTKYEKNVKLFEKLRELTKEHDVIFTISQQPIRKDFVGRSKMIDLHPKSEHEIIIIDHINLIGK